VALKIAADESDWIGQHSEWLYAVSLFAGSLLCVGLVYHVLQLSVLRRATREAAGELIDMSWLAPAMKSNLSRVDQCTAPGEVVGHREK